MNKDLSTKTMNKSIFRAIVLIIALLGISNSAKATVSYSQNITLKPGWNAVSTPRVLDSQHFFVTTDASVLDIYVLDPSSPSGWATMSDLGQSLMTPLYGYFVNNKTGLPVVLTLNYKADIDPLQRLFSRNLKKPGWYSIGLANPSYAKDINPSITNAVSQALNAIGSYDTVIDFSGANPSDPNSVFVSSSWFSASKANADSLDGLREGKAYAIYVTALNQVYNGFQNSDISITNFSVSLAPNSQSVNSVTMNPSNVTSQAELGTFRFASANGTSTVTEIKMSIGQGFADFPGGNPASVLSNATLYDNGVAVKTSSLDAQGRMDFPGMSLTVPKDGYKDLTLKVDIAAGAPTTTINVVINATNDNIVGTDSNRQGLVFAQQDHFVNTKGTKLSLSSNSSGSNQTPAYAVTASAGNGGSISPSGAVSVNSGVNQTFTITPSNGYEIDTVTVDGNISVGAVSSYTFNSVSANHLINAIFKLVSAPPAASCATIPFASLDQSSGSASIGNVRFPDAATSTTSQVWTTNHPYTVAWDSKNVYSVRIDIVSNNCQVLGFVASVNGNPGTAFVTPLEASFSGAGYALPNIYQVRVMGYANPDNIGTPIVSSLANIKITR